MSTEMYYFLETILRPDLSLTKKFNLQMAMMVHFYTAIVESILTWSITIWYAASTAKDKSRLQRISRSTENVIGCNFPSLQDLRATGP